MVGGGGILTPSHTGAQPAKYTVGGETVRPLGGENDKAFALINALDEGQRKHAGNSQLQEWPIWSLGRGTTERRFSPRASSVPR